MDDCLEHLLLSLQAEGTADSSGVITLDPSRSLEKAAESQLPFPEAWILKIVQAAVAQALPKSLPQGRLNVRLMLRQSLWEWDAPGWTPEQFENAFVDYRSSGDVGLDHLIEGLWQVGLHHRRPFQVQFPGTDQSVIWDGQRLSRLAASRPSTVRLRISHRSLTPSQNLLYRLPGLEAAHRNAEVPQTLRNYAFASPLPLYVDGIRLDGFLQGPKSTWKSGTEVYSYFPRKVPGLPILPIGSGSFLPEQERFRVPFAPWPAWWAEGLRALEKEPQPQLVVLLGTVSQPRRPEVPNPDDTSCQLLWIHHGVLVKQEMLRLEPGELRFVTFVSAEGLTRDATSLGLVHNEAFRERRRVLLESLTDWLREFDLNQEATQLAEGQRKQLRGKGGQSLKVLLPFGGWLVLASAWSGLLSLGLCSGLMGLGMAHQYRWAPQQAQRTMGHLHDLKARWAGYLEEIYPR